MKTVCGWCPKVLVEGDGPVSHGICSECAASLTEREQGSRGQAALPVAVGTSSWEPGNPRPRSVSEAVLESRVFVHSPRVDSLPAVETGGTDTRVSSADALGSVAAVQRVADGRAATDPSAAVSPPPIDPAALVALGRARRAWEMSCPQLFLEV